MQTVTTIGLDIAKLVFQVHGVDADGQVVKVPVSTDMTWRPTRNAHVLRECATQRRHLRPGSRWMFSSSNCQRAILVTADSTRNRTYHHLRSCYPRGRKVNVWHVNFRGGTNLLPSKNGAFTPVTFVDKL